MKIAVTHENGQIFQHFGHTEQFMIYTVEGRTIISSEILDTNGSGHDALATLLAENHVEALICGGIGAGAQMALAQAGVLLFAGITGGTDEAIAALLDGTLAYNAGATCSHHDHGDGHSCGHHHGEGHNCHSHGCGGGHKCSHHH